ncbi:MAG: glycosyltransferase [Dehalococcoidia bacterium]|nr:glycosyltransferase [Dehalococcoidia bacterium]
MKVVFLADAPYIHEQRWIRHFVARGNECDVISFRPAEIEGARVHHIDGAETLGKARYLVHARRVKRLVHSLKPDLVHALHLTSYGFLGALAGFHPLVISVFGTDILEAPHLTPFHHWLTRHALAHADAITATGLHLATETTRYAPRGTPVTVVPYGVEMERFALTTARPARDEVVFGTASRLSPEKGIRYLIEAFALLRARYGDKVRLVIAGDTTPAPGGPDRRALEGLAEQLGVAGMVEFRGWVDHESLPAFLGELDVFVLPSIYEGFGVAALEASAMALPVVASNVHGIPDVVRDGATGLLVPPKDPQALADACARLVDDPALRQNLGSSGRAYTGEHYDWRQNAVQMERVYERVTSSKQQVTRSAGRPGVTSQ